MGVKGLCRHQIPLSMFSELCVCYLQNWVLAVSVWRANCCLGNSLGCLVISMIFFWLTSELDVTQSWYWNPHYKIWLAGFCLLCCMAALLWLPSYYRKFPLHSVCTGPLKCSSIVAGSSNNLPLSLISPHPSHLTPLLLSPLLAPVNP